MNLDMPTPTADVDQNGNFDRGWVAWLTRATNCLVSRSQASTTAKRPTSGLEIGTPYFDTSLGAHGKPIWCSQVKPSVVWVDATSAVV